MLNIILLYWIFGILINILKNENVLIERYELWFSYETSFVFIFLLAFFSPYLKTSSKYNRKIVKLKKEKCCYFAQQ